MEVIFACACERGVQLQLTVEEESALVSEARSRKINGRWKFFENDKGQEHSNFRISKLEEFSNIATFMSCVMSKTMWRKWMLYH